ncbi:MAG: transglutaminase family protein, partial [Planctomycetota bacterium]
MNALAQQVDTKLEQQDVRLTMGGEPTFVAIDEPDHPTWNTAAVGGSKRQLAHQLIRRLRNRFAPGSLLHTGQGKWYPGEPFPRWALAVYARRDGRPIWANDDLLATPDDADRPGSASPESAQRFIQTLAHNLAVHPGYAQPVYEDAEYYQRLRNNLP